MTWKCTGCGTENPDDAMYCTTCGLKRPDESVGAQSAPQETVENAGSGAQPTEQQEQAVQQLNQSVEAQAQTQEQQAQQTEVQTVTTQENQAQTTTTSQQSEVTETPTAQEGKYYIQFIATPVSALNKTKVPLDFDVFENISLGRSPENVLMIPDSEISRRHAILSKEGDTLYIEDLNSTNGTYIYDGKVFQAVKGKAQLPKNAVVKLGNNTIIKIVRE
ncbi:hypothetical protein L3N51_00451 [Metallosphaera sp. J1]|uniref:FHA domain-containing protein n=1 Tax=Metallosphaera javensis (ex Hofmann et al. 2022) TaxID=99938 RepID=UPI001EE11B72|nr:FHA domain-containing protein [Metallosphaera javensis (ex Hofmann et al. 2022)]MCG3108170.1 hypothetical protein [Metallosphaera javensis (ex Hofmann et al. 2022)]